MPRSAGVLITFFVCGFVHDLPFVVLNAVMHTGVPQFTLTLFLTINGLLLVVTELTHLKFTRLNGALRPFVHGAVLVLSYWGALLIDLPTLFP